MRHEFVTLSVRDRDLLAQVKFRVAVDLVLRYFSSRGNAGSPSDGSPSKLCATLDFSRGLRVDGIQSSLTPADLSLCLGTARAQTVVDVRPSSESSLQSDTRDGPAAQPVQQTAR